MTSMLKHTEIKPAMKNQTLRSIVCGISTALFLSTMVQAENPASTPADRDGLLLEYRFEGDASDTSGNNQHGDLLGQPAFVEGRHGKCLSLSGRGDYVDTLLASADLGDTFTVECWVKPDAGQNAFANIFGNHADGGLGIVVQQDGGNVNSFNAAFGKGDGQWATTPQVQLDADKWQHVAVVKTPESLSFFLNGKEVASVPASAPMAASPMTLRVGLGYADLGRCFSGCIDEFRVWKKAVTDFGQVSK